MSEGFYSLVVDYVKGRKLKLACEYCLVSEKVGRELISRAVCVTRSRGVFDKFSYLFELDGIYFYFNSDEDINEIGIVYVDVKELELPK